MLKDFIIYYFLYNEYTVLPLLMMYIVVGTLASIGCIGLELLYDWICRAFGGGNDNIPALPNFLKFSTFYIWWFATETFEIFCKKMFHRGWYLSVTINRKMTDWMYK